MMRAIQNHVKVGAEIEQYFADNPNLQYDEPEKYEEIKKFYDYNCKAVFSASMPRDFLRLYMDFLQYEAKYNSLRPTITKEEK